VVEALGGASTTSYENLHLTDRQFTIEAAENPSISAERAFMLLTTGRRPNRTIRALYDTGASVTVIKPADMQTIKNNGIILERVEYQCGIVNASQKPMTLDACYRITLYYKKVAVTGVVLVSPDVKTSIIGMNFIRAGRFILDPLRMKVCFAHELMTPPPTRAVTEAVGDEGEGAAFAEVHILRTTVLPAKHGKLVHAALVDSAGRRINQELQAMVDMDIMAVAVNTDKAGAFYVHLPNAGHMDRTLSAGQRIGRASSLLDWTPLSAAAAVERVKEDQQRHPLKKHTVEQRAVIRKAMEKQVNHTVPYQYRSAYMDMLGARENFFSADPHDLGLTMDQQHTIDLKENTPTFVPQFRLPAEHLKMIQENVAGWMQAGIVEKSASPHNAPIFCVPKKSGFGLRCVLDYRSLNRNSLSDKYSIRTIDECIEEIGKHDSTVFSALDLTNGYWQLRLRATDRPYTAFTIPGKGQYQWITTPQGLMGAPASFSRLMDIIMCDAHNVITYLDDCLVHSSSHEEHLKHLAEAIDRIGGANLRLNPNKCIFGAAEVEYLGHTITSKGVRPGTDKAAAVKEATPPATPRELKSFLGLANYFRGYIKDFSRKAAPLFALTREDSTWQRGALPHSGLEAFHSLRREIAARPVMAFPRPKGEYHLFVDATVDKGKTAGGLGAVLMQDQPDGVRRPVAFGSRRLSKHEQNYPPFLVQIQAAVYGMETYQHLLAGRHFYLYTDQQPIGQLGNAHTKTLNRLQLKMQDMHPDIRYIDDNHGAVQDFLTRYHDATGAPLHHHASTNDAVALLTHKNVSLSKADASPRRVALLQKQDTHWGPIHKDIGGLTKGSTPEHPVLVKLTGEEHRGTVISDVLYVCPSARRGPAQVDLLRAAAPRAMHEEIINEIHNSQTGAPDGHFRSQQQLQRIFWWPTMTKDINDHQADCVVCSVGSDDHGEVRAVTTTVPSAPAQRIHADLHGPAPESANGNTHILAVTDEFSQHARIYPIKDNDPASVAKGLLADIYTFGCPRTICLTASDRTVRTAVRDHIDSKLHGSAPTPSCTSMKRVFNSRLRHAIAEAITDAEKTELDWELLLGPLMLVYNSKVCSSTRLTPFETTFGYDPRVPLWAGKRGEDLDDMPKNIKFQDYLAHLRQAQGQARRIMDTSRERHTSRTTDADGGLPSDIPTPIRNDASHDDADDDGSIAGSDASCATNDGPDGEDASDAGSAFSGASSDLPPFVPAFTSMPPTPETDDDEPAESQGDSAVNELMADLLSAECAAAISPWMKDHQQSTADFYQLIMSGALQAQIDGGALAQPHRAAARQAPAQPGIPIQPPQAGGGAAARPLQRYGNIQLAPRCGPPMGHPPFPPPPLPPSVTGQPSAKSVASPARFIRQLKKTAKTTIATRVSKRIQNKKHAAP
jgi:hypothetical protein